MTVSLKGHHGTSCDSAKLILESGFKQSLGDNEWLGDGVYFFVDGVSSKTVELAEKWLIAEAWDKNSKSYKYETGCVLCSLIEVKSENFLDLTVSDGVEILKHLLDCFEKKINEIGKKLNFIDGLLINLARKEKVLPIEVAKGNFYIKFKEERIRRINQRTNNCTVCSVYEPSKNIKSTEVVLCGKKIK